MDPCGCFFTIPHPHEPWQGIVRAHLPLISLRSHTGVVSSTARTTLTQTFVNPQHDRAIPELRYRFPLYDGVSVVDFVCTINKDRVVRGRVKEKDAARRAYKDAVDRGETAGLLEQLPDAADVFVTTIGNVPAGAELSVDVTYLGELKHDAEADGFRFTIPTSIAQRYAPAGRGHYVLPLPTNVSTVGSSIDIVVDVELPTNGGNHIKTIKSPSHPVSVEMRTAGAKGISAATAEISIPSLQLDKDVVVVVVPAKPDAPVAVLEQHPTISGQRALMATFVPRFNLPQIRPEIVFVCDRSGSMGSGNRIPNLKAALHVFLRSLPVGVKFNIVSFGSRHSFLFDRSRPYDQASLDEATRHVDSFDCNYGGTEMYEPIDQVFQHRYADMDLEIFVLTDGEVWGQPRLFDMVNENMGKSKGAARLFTLGIGGEVSHALVEGLARAGRGFAQVVGDNEKLNSKVVRMLKASLSPHISDYSLEIQYGADATATSRDKPDDDDFEVVEAEDAGGELAIEKVLDALALNVAAEREKSAEDSNPGAPHAPEGPPPAKPISIFDAEVDPDGDVTMGDEMGDSTVEPKYAHVPAVPTPKLLQAPFEIPPMYNFNRTSIYLLLGPSSCPRTPRALVLRGTVPFHGPVELSVPVQRLPRPGKTLHQLAAKKAVQELEEGRGWLLQAKDVADGRLLKDKYEGRFSDMVEREAVRLGVEFQVGGKWCSFVAVEDQTDKIHATPERPEPSISAPKTGRTSLFAAHRAAPVTAGALFGEAPSPPAACPMPTGFDHSFGVSNQIASTGGAFGSSGASPGGLFGGVASPAVAAAQGGGGLFGSTSSSGGGGLFGLTSAFGGGHFGGSAAVVSSSAVPRSAGPRSFGFTASRQNSGDLFGGSAAPAAPRSLFGTPANVMPEASVSSDPLSTLVKQQAFEGFWDWSSSLYTALGFTGETVVKVLPASIAGKRTGATLCAVAFMRKKLADKADEWEMLVDKAIAWLEAQGVETEVMVATAEKLF